MGLVSKSIPNLINGVSQQPPSLRLDTQGEVQENGLSDVVDGLKKRPPTKFLKKLIKITSAYDPASSKIYLDDDVIKENLSEDELSTAFFHTYKRSDEEQYQVIITNDKTIYVYDIEGNLRYQSGKGSWAASGFPITANSDNTDYLPYAGKNLTATSVADATFIVNKTKTVQMDSDKIIPSNNVNQALVYLKSVNYGRDYTCTVTSKTENQGFTATKSSIEQVTKQSGTDAGTTNDNELKVSKIMSDTGSLRSAVATALGTSNEWSYSGGGVAYDQDYTVLLIIGGLGNALTTTAVNAGEFTVRVGGMYIPYDSTGANGWKRHDNNTIHLPSSVIIQQGGQTGALTRDAVLVKRVTASNAGYLTPVTPSKEPYFIINTLDSGTIKDFNIQVTDDDGGVNLKAFKGNAKSFTDLPNQCENGFRLGVVGDNQKKEDDFHVVFTGEAGSGYWKETVGYNLVNYYDKATMPHTLRQNGDLSFTFEQGEWQERKAGDDNTNPAPSFVSGDQPSRISDIFFHRNRLGILSGENVIFSEAGNEFNFWRTTVRTLLDSDPIDVAVSQNEVSELKAAVPIQDNLLLFSDLNQFTLSASQLLTPAEVTVDQSTKYECDLTSTPVGAGTSVFFATKSGNYAGVREFFTKDDTEIKDAVDITAHVPKYLEGNIRHLTASSNEDTLVTLTSDNRNECYIYKWYNSTQERLQSSWSKWTFFETDDNGDKQPKDIASVFFNNAKIFFTFENGSYEEMDLAAIDAVYLDNQIEINALTVDHAIPDDYPTSTMICVSEEGYNLGNFETLNAVPIPNVITDELNDGKTLYIGEPYTFKYQVSEQVFKPVAGDATHLARFQLRKMTFNYSNTGKFNVTVDSVGRNPSVATFTARVLGQSDNILDQAVIDPSGSFEVGVQSQPSTTKITITNDTHLPSVFQSAEWEGFVTLRNQRL